MKSKTKTLIVGGGTPGLYLAWKLSEKGADVTLFDKKNEPKNEACSGLFSEKIISFIPEAESIVKNKISSTVINFPKKKINVKFSEDFFVIDHSDLDKLIYSKAIESGAKIYFNHEVSSIPEEFERVIGCDGALSMIRNKIKPCSPKIRLGIKGFIEEKNDSDFVETWPTKNGFIWKIPRGENTEYGILHDPSNAKEILKDFLNKRNIKIGELKAGIVPHKILIPKNSKMTICGDSAGMTKPWSGGGVVWSLKAADILIESFPDFNLYRKRALKFFIPRYIFSQLATKTVYFLGFNIPFLMFSKYKIESDFLL